MRPGGRHRTRRDHPRLTRRPDPVKSIGLFCSSSDGLPQATRELAAQVETAFRDYGRFTDLRTTVIFGGVGYGQQREDLKRGMDILIATPGRLLDLLERKEVHLSDVKYLVFDEADRMLDMGFKPQVERIIQRLPRSRQTMLFSATLDGDVAHLVARYMKDPHNLNLDPTSERYHELMDFLGQLPEDHPLNPNHEVPTTNLSPKVSTEAIIINLSSSVPTRTSDSQEELTSQSASFISDTVSEVNGNPVLPE